MGRTAHDTAHPMVSQVAIPLSARICRFWIQRKLLAHRFHGLLHALLNVLVINAIQDVGNPVADRFHLGFAHAARRESRRSDTNAAWRERWIPIERYRVLVYRDSGFIQRLFRLFPI